MTKEREYLATARATRARMLDTARYRVATGEAVAGDGYTAEVLGRMLRSYAKELAEEPNGPLYFGRLSFGTGPDAGDHAGQRYYLGRRRIADESGTPIVVDWRAPVSRSFYRATATEPAGVTVRRRYGWTLHPSAELTSFEDEHLYRGQDLGAGSHLVTAEIERPASRAHAGHRRHHPARPGRVGPGRARRLHLRPGRAGHRPGRPRAGSPRCARRWTGKGRSA